MDGGVVTANLVRRIKDLPVLTIINIIKEVPAIQNL